MKPLISLVVLTYKRPAEITRNLSELLGIKYAPLEIFVVNNGDEKDLRNLPNDERLTVINLNKNLGVAGRNVGIKHCSGEYIVTLDDDVFGFDSDAVNEVITAFEQDQKLCAVNFRVVDDLTEEQVNWIHHREIDRWSNRQFETYEISEGAVAFRRKLLMMTDLYPESFFISHEGPDLALQIMKTDAKVIYDPTITVRHSHAEGGRVSWRRYYYDTRNQVWLAKRHYPLVMALRKLVIGLGSMLVYAARDGYLSYFFRGVHDGFRGLNKNAGSRIVLSNGALERYIRIEKDNACFWYMLKRRLFRRRLRI